MIKTLFFLLLTIFSASIVTAADWSLPLSIQSGSARTTLTLAVQAGASNGFDAGKDVPGRPYEDDLLYASFPHPEWVINMGGEAVYDYSRDSRGSLPQEFLFQVICKQSQVTLSWNPSSLPAKTSFLLNHPTSGTTVDMSTRSSYSFNPGGTSAVPLSIQVSQGDISPPSAPSGVNIEERESSLYISWDRSSDADAVGYKVHFGTDSDSYSRSINVRDVTNYSLFNLSKGEVYYIAITAYDAEGNESSFSSEVSGSYQVDPEPSDPDPSDPATEVTSGAVKETTRAPSVPENEDVLPSKENDPSTTTTGRGVAVSSVYLNLPGQSEQAQGKVSSGGKKQVEQRKEAAAEGAVAGVKEGAQGQDNGPGEPELEASVSNKAGTHRIELDEHPWKLLTIPLQVQLDKPFAEFVALSAEVKRLTGWDSELQAYRRVKYPRPGTAFWLKAGKGYAVLEGQPYRGKEARFVLVKGWNLLGSPYLEAVPFQHVRIQVEDQQLTLAAAVKSALLVNDLQSYVSGDFVHEPLDKKGQLEPWRGYWIFANQPCELILSPNAVAQAKPMAKPVPEKPEDKAASIAMPDALKEQAVPADSK